MRKVTKLWAFVMAFAMFFSSFTFEMTQANTITGVPSQWKLQDNNLTKKANTDTMYFTSNTPTMMSTTGGGSGNKGIINLQFSALCIYTDDEGVKHPIDIVFSDMYVKLYQIATLSSEKGVYTYTARHEKYEEFSKKPYPPYEQSFDLLYGDTLINEEVVEFARCLTDITINENISYYERVKTDKKGMGSFKNLPDGLYLILFDDQTFEYTYNDETIQVVCDSQPILLSSPGYAYDSDEVVAILLSDDFIEYATFIENGDGTAVLHTGETLDVTGQDVAMMSDISSISTSYGDWVYDQDVFPKMQYAFNSLGGDETMDVSVKKIWEDNDDEKLYRPDDVTVGLYYNSGQTLYETVTLNDENDWKYEWEGIDILDWSMAEVDVPLGYESIIADPIITDGGMHYHYEVTNTLVEYPVMQINVEKNWCDENGGDLPVIDIPVDEFGNALPVEIGLFNEDDEEIPVEVIALTEDDDWQGSFEDLDRRDDWYLEELSEFDGFDFNVVAPTYELDDYADELDFSLAFGVENEKIDETKKVVSVEKIWADDDDAAGVRPPSITIGLYENDVLKETKELNSGDHWRHTFYNLAATSEWEIKELTIPPGYSSAVVGKAEDALHYTYTITNTYPAPPEDPPTDPPEDPPEDPPTDPPKDPPTTPPPKDPPTTTTPPPETDDPPSDPPNDPPPTEETPSTDFTVTKIWNNDRNQYMLGLRPSFIQGVLYCDGYVFETFILTEEMDWTYTWTNLNPDLEWTVEERYIPEGYYVGYNKVGNTTEIHNTYQDFVFKNVATSSLIQMSEKIPQTGLVDWKLSMLSGFGLILISLGLFFDIQSKKQRVVPVQAPPEMTEIDCIFEETQMPIVSMNESFVAAEPLPLIEDIVPQSLAETVPQPYVDETIVDFPVDSPIVSKKTYQKENTATDEFIRVEAPKRKLSENNSSDAIVSVFDFVMPTTSLMLDKDLNKKSKATRKKRR